MDIKEIMGMDKKEIIKIAMNRIGTKHIRTLDGLTIVINDKWYNIYVDANIKVFEI